MEYDRILAERLNRTKLSMVLMGSLLICSSILAEKITLNKKSWHVLDFFDGFSLDDGWR